MKTTRISHTVGILAIAIMSCLLNACGGSDAPSTSSTPTPNSNSNTTNNPFGTGLSSKDASKPNANTTLDTSIQGVAASISSSGSSSGFRATTATPNINTVVIGDKSITLGSNLTTGTKFSHVSYGYLGRESTPTLFVQGKTSSSVPSTGKATYRGSAIHVTAGNSNATTQIAQASFDVDFDKKTLKGTINTPQKVNLEANISGNRFSGTASGISTTGYFYGDKADELGGLYRNTNGTVSGAYAAKK